MKREGGDEAPADATKKPRLAYSSPLPPGVPSTSQFPQLGPACQAEFHSLFQSNKVIPADIDDCIYKSLLDFSDQKGSEIIKSFSKAELASVRNKTGFFIGILKAHRKKGESLRSTSSSSSSASSSPSSAPPAAPPPAYGYPPPSAYPYFPPSPYPQYPYPPFDPYGMPPPSDPSLPPLPFGMPYPYGAPPGSYPPPFAPYAGAPYPYPYPVAYPPDPQAPYQPPTPPPQSPSDLANPSTYQERSAAKTHVSRRPGGGLAALSKPIQDLFSQIFNMGHVSKDDVPDSIYDSLQGFEEDVQWAIVERFSKADLARVRNKTGYLIGILKIARQGKAAGQGFGSSKLGPTPTTNPSSPFDEGGRGSSSDANQNPPMEQSPAFSKLAPFVQQKFRELVRRQQIRDGDLDLGVFTSLAAFDEASQIDVVDIFASKDLANIQNKTGFFIGIIKKQRVLKQNQDMVQGWN